MIREVVIPLSHYREVAQWLGLSRLDPPTGLHGPKRRGILERHTRRHPNAGGRFVAEALARAYPRNREKRLQALLRPRRLDDDLWRAIYALMVTGGPVLLGDLVPFIARLTSERPVAQREAVEQFRRWDKLTYAED